MKLKRKSKMLWFNGLTILLTFAGIGLQYVNVLGLDPVVAGKIGFGLSLFTALANIGLRLVTKEALVGTGK